METLQLNLQYNSVTVTATVATGDTLTTGSTAGFYLGMPIQSLWSLSLVDIVAGTTYYVRTIVANTSFTISYYTRWWRSLH